MELKTLIQSNGPRSPKQNKTNILSSSNRREPINNINKYSRFYTQRPSKEVVNDGCCYLRPVVIRSEIICQDYGKENNVEFERI